MKYEIVIEEVISDIFGVDADSEEEAISMTIDMYKSGDIVLSPGNLEHKQLAVIKTTSDELDWIPF